MSYRIQFLESARFMARLLSNIVNNLAEGIHKIKCKYGNSNKKCENCRSKYEDCECFIVYVNFKDDLIEYKFLCCNKNDWKRLNETLKKQFFNTYAVLKHDNNRLTLLLRKGVFLMNAGIIEKSSIKFHNLEKKILLVI